MKDNHFESGREITSSDPSMTRTEFLQKALKGIGLISGAALAPRVVDKFLIPPAYAKSSTCTVGDFPHGSTTVQSDRNTFTPSDAISNFGSDTLCTGD